MDKKLKWTGLENTLSRPIIPGWEATHCDGTTCVPLFPIFVDHQETKIMIYKYLRDIRRNLGREVIGFGLFMIPFKFWWCTRMYILPRVIETFVKLSLERRWPIIECRRPSTGRNSKNENVLSSFLFFFFSSAEFTNHHNWKCFLSRTQKTFQKNTVHFIFGEIESDESRN